MKRFKCECKNANCTSVLKISAGSPSRFVISVHDGPSILLSAMTMQAVADEITRLLTPEPPIQEPEPIIGIADFYHEPRS